MAWVRSGDTSATYPLLMSVVGVDGADGRSVNEVFGFVSRLAMLSAAHLTDYVVDAGTVAMIGGENTTALLALCTKVGLLKRCKVSGMVAYKVIDDPEFLHLRLKAEIEWERQQQSDGRNESLTVPIRQRDGDLCRYCTNVVMWRGRTSPRSATFDHTEPGEAGTVDTMVVACRGCNSELRDMTGREREHLKPVPPNPYYSEFTADWLTDRGRPTAPTPRPDNQSDNAPRKSRKKPSGQRADNQSATASSDSDPAPDVGHRAHATGPEVPFERHSERDPVAIRSSNAGQGRVGSGNEPLSGSRTTNAGSRRPKRSPRGRNRQPGAQP